MPESFDVFLSHNSKDKPAVRELAEALQGRGLKVWLDEWELVPGRPWQEALEEIIETTRTSAVLVGKDGLGPWQDAEMRGCLAEFVDRKHPVIPVLLPDAPAEPKLPFFLRRFTWVDLRGGLTKEGLDRLQWGITGKRPDRSESLSTPVAAPEAAIKPPVAVAQREEQTRSLAGETFTEPLTGIRFLWIPGGRFQMGGDAFPDEKPIHWVRISPFWLGETPVTNRQYSMFLQATGVREPDYWRDPRYSSPDQPVVGVSWEDAQAFCRWLSKESGREVMLPSEAQWEFAARGTDGREFPWGNEPPDETRACFKSEQSAPVGAFSAGQGPFGTLDQAGNVWEWCRDAWYEEVYLKRTKERRKPVDPVEGEELIGEEVRRVLRGGCWSLPADRLRAAYRIGNLADRRSDAIGFRVTAAPASLVT